MASLKKTLYDILGVSRDANAIDIGLAHDQRRAELQRAVPQDPSALALLHEAYEVLNDPQRRAAYDGALVTAAEKAAALEQAKEPDLVVEAAEEEVVRRKFPPVGIAAGVAVVLILIFLALHRAPAPESPRTAPEPVAEAPKPAPPPPPKTAKDILTLALASVGRLQAFEMSGRAVPLGLAVAVEPGGMVTTCHGIPADSALVVTVAGENHSATLTMTDEVLDLCRISVAGFKGQPLPLAAAEAREGEKIYALGANANGEFALTEGTVQKLLPDARGKVVQISMPVAPNGSGGAVFDADGNVIAIATTAQGHGAGVALALPSAWIAKMRSRGRS